MPGEPPAAIAEASAAEARAALPDLADLLRASVLAGASVNFVLPFGQDEAEAFWTRKVFPVLEAGTRVLLLARRAGRVIGSVQLDCDTPPNQPHRGEVTKLLVHPDHRRRGIARALMRDLERRAAARGRTLLTLDTRTGDPAERLYASLGFRAVGTIPRYCLDTTGGRLDSTTIMYRMLRAAPASGD